MNHRYKGKAKYISVWTPVLLLLAITMYSHGNSFHTLYFHSSLTADTIPKRNLPVKKTPPVFADTSSTNKIKPQHSSGIRPVSDEVSTPDTITQPKTDTFRFKTSKDSLDAPVFYHADDSMVLDVPGKKILLYGKQSFVKYLDNTLTAPHIEFDQRTNEVSAYLTKDSNGNVISYPVFNQGDFITQSDSIRFNMKTQRGITKGTYTQQGEIFVYGEKIKKVDPFVFYAYRGRFTTCNLDTPHFAFVAKKIKFIRNKTAYSGPVHPEVEGVPIPVILPFGIFPMKQGRHSGLLPPTFTANEQLGLALDGLGYYKVLSPTWDMVFRGTIYSYGGWTANLSPRYYKRYHYQGNLSFDVQHFRDLDKSGTRSYNIRWTHSSDNKARPGVTFSANVNAGSSGFNSAVPNSPQRNFQNQLNSSITYSKVWKDKPFNITVSANHNQNTALKLINLNLPDIAFNVNTLYPFRRKEVIGAYKWYENFGIALNTNAKSLTSFYDTTTNIFKHILDTLQWGASHNVPISLSLPEVAHLQFAPSISYQENWYQNKVIHHWDKTLKTDVADVKKGFYTSREMSFALGLSTRIFGMFGFRPGGRIMAIRHEIRPSIGVSYHPNMNGKNYYSSQVDSAGSLGRFSLYERNIFGAFGEGKSGSLNFNIDNNIQMKVRSRRDTTAGGIKKITLLDGLSLGGSYNFLADSFKLSTFSISARTNLFEKFNVTASGTLDPYLTNDNGDRIDKYVWSRHPVSLGKLVYGSIALQTQFKGGNKSEKLPLTGPQHVNPVSGLPLNEYQQEAAYINNNPAEFANFNIPWSLSFSYGLNYQRIRNISGGFKGEISQSVNWTGSLNLTAKWQIGMNSSYNITTGELGMVSIYLTREMHCWQMAINASPVGKYRYFNVSISPKSSILRDLKINRTRYFYSL